MNILQINKYFYPRGGAEQVLFETIAGLRARGHSVAEFAMRDERNINSPYAKYFAPPLPELLGSLSLTEKWRVFNHLFYSGAVEKNLNQLIDDFKPEVAHIHNAYHQLSASTFLILARRAVPMVMTLHDVFPLCPNHSLLYGETWGEEIYNKKLWRCLAYRCVAGKFMPSLAGVLEALYYRYRGVWNNIKFFICPSDALRIKMIAYGFPKEKLTLLRNHYALPPTPALLGTAIVYLGRLHFEKGIKIFLKALPALREYPVIIAGAGPERELVQKTIQEQKLSNVNFVGEVNGPAWQNVMQAAKVVVVPSIFFENCSRTILEALGSGRVVVASNRGGNAELVREGETGFMAKPEDAADLARVLHKAMNLSAAETERLGQNGRRLVEEQHNREQYFSGLENIFKLAIK